ncbi:MAG: isopenicillin N synthase-like dioxygenase [Myxococcota bacterium]|jgi:isopenicillin N synthase-like dioxygenase
MIPDINIAALFDGASADRDVIDRDILRAACDVGFLSIHGLPDFASLNRSARTSLLSLFSLPEAEQRKLWKSNFAPENPNLYRGWFPLESGEARSREGFEIGPDIVRELHEDGSEDLLYEPTVFPPEALVPGWRQAAAKYYEAMEQTGATLLASLSRGMGIDEAVFRNAFNDGISTLRLLRYPGRDWNVPIPDAVEPWMTQWNEERVEVVCGAHVDSGLVTILSQCDVPGLQVKPDKGEWLEVPALDDRFVVNFGGLLARWTGGRIRATRHRVLSSGGERFSIPFFCEPRANTVISALPLEGIAPFAPFQYGDHLWATTTRFPENRGLGALRRARAPYVDPFESSS